MAAYIIFQHYLPISKHIFPIEQIIFLFNYSRMKSACSQANCTQTPGRLLSSLFGLLLTSLCFFRQPKYVIVSGHKMQFLGRVFPKLFSAIVLVFIEIKLQYGVGIFMEVLEQKSLFCQYIQVLSHLKASSRMLHQCEIMSGFYFQKDGI